MSQEKPVYYCNGKFLPSDIASLSVHDLGLIRGFAVFESLRTYAGKPFLLAEHLDRLFRGARGVGIRPPLSKAQITSLTMKLLKMNKIEDALVRIILTGGPSESLVPVGKASLVIFVDPFHAFPTRQYEKGISMMSTPFSRLHPEYKSTIYFSAVMSTMRALKRGFDEAVYVDQKGSILEGTTYNVFAVLPGPRLVTAENGVLRGITAQHVLRLARRLKIPVLRAPITLPMLRKARELFITSSNRELIPAIKVDSLRIGAGRPGPVTRTLHAVYQQTVNQKFK